MLPCVDCSVLIDEDVWHEEMGMCVDCSNEYYSHDDEECSGEHEWIGSTPYCSMCGVEEGNQK